MPVVPGRRPDMRLHRDGLHSGAWQWALAKVTPFAASRAMLGVRASGCPPSGSIQSLRSSTAIISTFGGPSSGSPAVAPTGRAAARRRASGRIGGRRFGVRDAAG